MTHPTYEHLAELRSNAQTELSACGGAVTALVNQMRQGVSFEEGVEIINRFWEPREAMELKTKLFNNFPQQNARTILEKGLDDRVGKTIQTQVTQTFFETAGQLLGAQIQVILNHVNGLSVQGSEGVDILNNTKANITKFLGYVNWGVYEIRLQLLGSADLKWEALSTNVEVVDSGDYLFLENLGGMVDEALKNFIKRELPDKWDMSLGGVEYRFGTLDAMMELVMLYAGYLFDYPLGE